MDERKTGAHPSSYILARLVALSIHRRGRKRATGRTLRGGLYRPLYRAYRAPWRNDFYLVQTHPSYPPSEQYLQSKVTCGRVLSNPFNGYTVSF